MLEPAVLSHQPRFKNGFYDKLAGQQFPYAKQQLSTQTESTCTAAATMVPADDTAPISTTAAAMVPADNTAPISTTAATMVPADDAALSSANDAAPP